MPVSTLCAGTEKYLKGYQCLAEGIRCLSFNDNAEPTAANSYERPAMFVGEASAIGLLLGNAAPADPFYKIETGSLKLGFHSASLVGVVGRITAILVFYANSTAST